MYPQSLTRDVYKHLSLCQLSVKRRPMYSVTRLWFSDAHTLQIKILVMKSQEPFIAPAGNMV